MEYKGPYYYTLQLSGNEDKRVLSPKVYNGKVSNFKSTVTKKQTPKIYIVKHKNKIVYVGYASQSIGKRLGQGLRNSGVNKNLGYKWKELLEV
ncbi:hypothetical protein [Polaribacter sargassicola]|uniref:hypothetical protein n=1 Tax=Polaribacter sargassicola TaxID=2836891 RepID=UPI001F393EF2|nr:hypothetical protein [Polaribacter sp. DS7-9]MCG1035516.1 hypothetical protein [Polaribacter sp. DS7-9]